MKSLKDKTIHYYTIKIDLVCEREREGGRIFYKDKLWCADMQIGDLRTSFCQPTLEALFRVIKEELGI